MIISNDFCYMWRGQYQREVRAEELCLLQPFTQYTNNKNRALLLLHGFSSSPAVYRALIPKIKNYDTILCPLLPGHGTNIADLSTTKADDWLNTAMQSCQELFNTHESVDVMGLSLGGILAHAVSIHFPIRNLYLLAPAFKLNLNLLWAIYAARGLKFLGLKSINQHAGNIYSEEYQELTYKRIPLQAIIEVLTFIKNYEFTQPNCSTKLFLGKFDNVIDGEYVAKLFQNSQKTNIYWLENSAHVLPIDGDRDTIITFM